MQGILKDLRLHYSYYGWRARIGVLLPAINVTMEPELNRMAPEGVSFHFARLSSFGPSSHESYAAMGASVKEGSSLLKMTGPSVMIFGCTSGSFIEDDREIIRTMEAETGVPAITTSGAVLEALRFLKISSLAVATPYVEFINEAEKSWLAAEGFQVKELQGLELGRDEYERKLMGRQPAQIAYALAFQLARSKPDGVFISCTNFAIAPFIETLEADLGIPVVTSNQATLWAALRKAGLKAPVEGYGSLLRAKG